MKNIRTFLFAMAFVLSYAATSSAQQSQCDKACVQAVKESLKASYDGVSLGWLEKENDRLGDKVGVAVLKIYRGKALYKPDNIRTFLPVIKAAFDYPEVISNPQDKSPKVTAALLRRLQRHIKDHFLHIEITETLNSVLFSNRTMSTGVTVKPL